MLRTRFELMLTLECHWGCADCCRAVDRYYPKDSHMTIEQAERFVEELKRSNIYVSRLKINGGDPVHNPDFERLIWFFYEHKPELFGSIKVQTAYPAKAIRAKYELPRVTIRCEPIDSKNHKDHHVPFFVSPAETGVLPKGKSPPFGSWETKRGCEIQSRCGRSWERWGFLACAQEGVIGRLIGRKPHSKNYKHWADPEICKHCPVCLGKKGSRSLQQRTIEGEFSWISDVFAFSNIQKIYNEASDEPW